MNWETYLAFGDSITIGARTYLGYPELVGKKLSDSLHKQWNVINHAVSGYTAMDLARYIDLHFSTLQSHRASLSTILIGTNDIKAKTPLEDYLTALNQVVLKAKLLTVNQNVILFSIPTFHKGIMYPYSIEMNQMIEVYNAAIQELASTQNLRVLTLNHAEEDFLDGVHLNRTGIDHFSSQISNFILKDKGIGNG